MKIFDCTTYFQEDLMMDIRFNILDEYVDRFIVCEANFTHSGKKKEIQFDKNNFKKFKNKIVHIVVNNEPDSVVKNINTPMVKRSNSVKRIEFQRDKIIQGLSDADPNDIIMYSDNDEIPNLKEINFNLIKEKIVIFQQKIFYYKFNLIYPNLKWYGTKCCRFKDLKKISWLRDIKNKKYPIYRADVFLSKLKFINLKIIKNGGWHFSNLKNAEELFFKYLNDENHAEFEEKNMNLKDIQESIKKKVIQYDHYAEKTSDRHNKEFSLIKADDYLLPNYLLDNKNKYIDWFE